jgi:hypothetical protein
MKTAFANKQETAHAWAKRSQAQGHESARIRRIFFEGDTIYSYGYHFPIASFYDKKKRGKVVEVLGSVSHVRMLNGNLTVVPTAWLEVAV